MQNLQDNLYSVESIVRLEQIAIKQFDIPAYTLMNRAGQAIFSVLQQRYKSNQKVLVLCGAGSNAGDGYVVARLAKQSGHEVSVISLIEPDNLRDEALQAYMDWLVVGKNVSPDITSINKADIIIDALLGTGISREVSGEWEKWINRVNRSGKPVISVDVPSGLKADTGTILGHAVKADITVSFIGLKQGLYTAQAKDVCGEILLDNLGVPDEAYQQVGPDAQLIRLLDHALLAERKHSSHKGDFGHVLIAGGDKSMPGAVILAARAALRAGAGLVTIVTVTENLEPICTAVPEAMVKTCEVDTIAEVFTDDLVDSISHIAAGMGLGKSKWSAMLLEHCVQLDKPMLLDADALNIIAVSDIDIQNDLVITPHPGEAARLLSDESLLTTRDIQNQRFNAIRALHDHFDTSLHRVVILKGSGTLIYDGQTLKLCNLGNAAMAAPGMGDVLSGIVIALMAQGVEMFQAATMGVCLHAAAAYRVSGEKTRGLLASDVIEALPEVLP